jgi:hypothetical protein
MIHGRPSIYPVLTVEMLLVSLLLRDSLQATACDKVHLKLAHRWFCRLGLAGGVPDYST